MTVKTNKTLPYLAAGTQHYTSASGDVVTFPGDGSPLKSLVVSIRPVQEGSGDPSPTNVRPISGRSECNVRVKPTYDPTANPTATIQLGQTIYGGTLDVLSGILKVTHASVTLSEENGAWSASNKYLQIYRDRLPYPSVAPPRFDGSAVICDRFRQAESISDRNISCGLSSNGHVRFYGEPDVEYGSVAGFIAALGYPTAIYPLDPVLTYQLTPTEISTLQGQNNVWADCGPVSVEYHDEQPGKIAMLLARRRPELLWPLIKGDRG